MAAIFVGDNLRIEAVYEDKGSSVSAVITHPHSLMGGNMNNNVVMAAWRVCLARNLSSIRFNFRGVGRSGGTFDEGEGEMDDLSAVIAHAAGPVVVIGYSFGAWVAVRLMKRVGGPWPCILVSPPNGMFTFPSLRDDPVWIVTGGYDQFCSIPGLEGLIGKERITVVQGADHFWLGEERPLERYLDGRLGLLVDGMA
ncbi:MAG TPA: alpha/beta fold hydrolase [Deltaproteobacteria bacterium]|jgi:alpha/beta superfamily hydrolase|nr:alpha/beta fold hydrolase [Deltaproteobacteria bacterium]HOC76697.1 alpha/beta fold hydrolase [Deltaproteobacteria bacterium]HOG84396.1 alpha/beta fold hydrolase [Deltaproteobacteria bacterium]HON95439.1 alpha/beta fold hydrolase [Deltaproteobacteria bacterium]HPJ07600.1 alpha/beta fold hydrolase [Deltaproteobacteria bacterium]